MISLGAVKNFAKKAWIIAVLGFVALYAFSKRDMISEAVSTLTVTLLFEAALLILLAKLCLTAVMRIAAGHFHIPLGWADSYRIYNLTQVAKYIPGSIWQFVGRIAILRERGVPAQDIRDSLLAEAAWVAGSSLVIALVLLLGYRPAALMQWLSERAGFINVSWASWGAGGALLVALVAVLSNKRLMRWSVRLFPPVRVLPVLFLTWLFLGAAFWLTLVPTAQVVPPLAYVVGIYCFAYVAGFLVPFAPAGLGVREVVLTVALLPYMAAETAAVMAAINRIIYFAVEVGAAGSCMALKKQATPHKIDSV